MSPKLYWKSLNSLLFPRACIACDKTLIEQEEFICIECSFFLPFSNTRKGIDNHVEKKFWGKIIFESAYSVFDMKYSDRVYKIIHKIKYKNQPKIAYNIGKIFGQYQREKEWLQNIDIILPIPLHNRKKRKRGYNQSLYFAKGLAQSTNIPVHNKVLKRKVFTISQTQKSRLDRYENMENVFQCMDPRAIYNKHLLIVDDVITTGATLLSAGQTLRNETSCKLSFLAIGNA
ncbi:MAG TPA: phosphoribosyltransferase family protein [Sphingobacterium sp.]|nr:phosphoribosyltransferase family protein [Sphingobacterium sp.]